MSVDDAAVVQEAQRIGALIPANPTKVVELDPSNNEPAATYTLGDDGVVTSSFPEDDALVRGAYSVFDIVDGKIIPDERMVMPNEGARFLRALFLSQFTTASRIVFEIS